MSKFLRSSAIILAIMITYPAQTVVTAQSVPTSSQTVEQILDQMTLEEKAGQMTQLTIQAVSKSVGLPGTPHEMDIEKLREVILEHHVGSILNVFDMAYTPEYWHEVIGQIQGIAVEESRLGIPILYGIDAVHGINYTLGATLFPQNLALASSWNRELAFDAGRITALETRASGIPWNFAPVLDLGRQPLWSRYFETFGEDVHLVTELGLATIEGYQGDSIGDSFSVAATGKHFLGYSIPLSGKDRTPAWIPDRMLLEYFVPPFRRAIDAGLQTVMINSGEINGVPVHASYAILTDLLRGELGFEGVAVTDWEDIGKLVGMHKVAVDEKDATRMAILAGIDMSMTPYTTDFARYVVELVREGAIPESRIDMSVRRILQLKKDLGLFEVNVPDPSWIEKIGEEASLAASRKAADESFVLLKNDKDVLPARPGARILLTGPAANNLSSLHGSWSYTWQGTNEEAYPENLNTVYEAFRAKFGDHVTYVPGSSMTEHGNLAEAVRAAQNADVVVVALGETPSVEKPGDTTDLEMADAQKDLVRAVARTGKPVVLVLLTNRPRLITDIVDDVDAILISHFPGPFGGETLADILTGEVNPSGKLPYTYPRESGSLVLYDHKHSEAIGPDNGPNGFNPLFAFGSGLSYSTFDYSNLTVTPEMISDTDTLTVTVTVRNSGSVAGKEVVQLYVSDEVATVTPPVRRLRGFEKIHLEPGQQKTVRFSVPVQNLSFIGQDLEATLEPGSFAVRVARLEKTIHLK